MNDDYLRGLQDAALIAETYAQQQRDKADSTYHHQTVSKAGHKREAAVELAALIRARGTSHTHGND